MAEFKRRKKRQDLKELKHKKTVNDYREIALTKMGKRQLMLTLLSIFGVTMLSIGSTFAIFTVSSKSAEYNVIKTGTLNINFAADASSTVGLNNALPMSDTNGLAQSGTTFTITNTGSLPANYSVSLKDDTDMVTQDNCSAKQLAKTNIKYSLDGSTASLLSTVIDSELISDNLKAGESKTFTLKLWIKEDATNEVLNKHYHGKIVVDASQEGIPTPSGADPLVAKANSEDLDYNTATDDQKKEMWAFTHEATEQLGATTDYRYIGADPNNYVKFNDELWRIIGVFDVDDGTGKIEKRMKIIRNESIGNYSWDNKDTSTGAEGKYGKNNWSDARLNYLLNSGHESETYGGSLYWNRKSGTCYYGLSNATTSCNFTSTGLIDTAKAMIGDAKWYLGGTDYTSSLNGLASHFYKNERGTAVYSGRNTNWTGKVGLMYLSDYGYATSGGDSRNRASCMAKELYNWDDSSYSDCKNNDWLLNTSQDQWTMSPSADNSIRVFLVSAAGAGSARSIDANFIAAARPVVHLKSTIKVISGSGTASSPYILG